MKLNYIKKINGKIIWKQIEYKEDLTFMRLAQRPLIIIKRINREKNT